MEDKAPGNHDQTVLVFTSPAKEAKKSAGTSAEADTELNGSFKSPQNWGQKETRTQTGSLSQTQIRTQTQIGTQTQVGTQTQNETQTQTQTNGTEGNQSQKPRDGDSKSKTECLFLRKGFCKHGRSGKIRDEEGLTCPYYHPNRMCQPYLRAGKTDRGCQKQDCNKMHPLICRDWKSGRECWNQDCTRIHPQEMTVDIRPQRNRTSPRMTQNFASAPQDRHFNNTYTPNTGGRQQYMPQENQAVFQGNQFNNQYTPNMRATHQNIPQQDQAVFLDFQKNIMEKVTTMVTQLLAQNQQQQRLQEQQQQQVLQQQVQRQQLPQHPQQQQLPQQYPQQQGIPPPPQHQRGPVQQQWQGP